MSGADTMSHSLFDIGVSTLFLIQQTLHAPAEICRGSLVGVRGSQDLFCLPVFVLSFFCASFSKKPLEGAGCFVQK